MISSLNSPESPLILSATSSRKEKQESNYREKYGYKGPYERKIDLTTRARIQNKQVKLDTEMLDRKFPLPGKRWQQATKRIHSQPTPNTCAQNCEDLQKINGLVELPKQSEVLEFLRATCRYHLGLSDQHIELCGPVSTHVHNCHAFAIPPGGLQAPGGRTQVSN